jgi:ElaB/YqjD/DUF883 family membrane-anchored ribosome-binding protein
MEILISLLEFSKKHSQAIIVILLGTIAAGGIAGGIWIRDLQDIVTSKDAALEQARKIEEERVAVAKQQLAAATATADVSLRESKAKVHELSANSHRMKEYVSRVDEVISDHLNHDRTLATALMMSPSNKGKGNAKSSTSAEQASAALIASVDETRSELSKVEDWVKWIDERSVEVTSPPAMYEKGSDTIAMSAPPPHLVGYFTILLGGLGALFFAWILVRFLRHRMSTTRQ